MQEDIAAFLIFCVCVLQSQAIPDIAETGYKNDNKQRKFQSKTGYTMAE